MLTLVIGSNIEIGKERVDIMINQAAFFANVSAMHTGDQMTGAAQGR